MTKKKVAICSDTLGRITGLGKTSLRIAKGFYDNGYDVIYIVLTGQDTDTSCKNLYDQSFIKDFPEIQESSKITRDEFKLLINKLLEIVR